MIKTIFWFIYFWLYLILTWPKLKRAQRLDASGDLDARDRVVDPVVQKWARSILRTAGVTVEVSGLENIPDEPVVFVPNHQSYFDIPVLLAWLDRPHPLIAKQEIKKLPLVRSWMVLLDCVFIDRSNARQSVAALGQASKNMTERGRSFIIFPEGTRSRGDVVGEFKSGGFRAALKAGVPVVPVVIDGTYRAMEANNMKIRSAHVKLIVLPPVPTKDLSREEGKVIGEKVRALIVAAKDQA